MVYCNWKLQYTIIECYTLIALFGSIITALGFQDYLGYYIIGLSDIYLFEFIIDLYYNDIYISDCL